MKNISKSILTVIILANMIHIVNANSSFTIPPAPGSALFSPLHISSSSALEMEFLPLVTDPVTAPETQLYGIWYLEELETTDTQMLQLMNSAGYRISLQVTEEYLQTTLSLGGGTSERVYQDPPLKYTIEEGMILMESDDFDAALSEGKIILVLTGMGEVYRYTFIREQL